VRRPPNISALLILAAASGLASCKTVATPEAVTHAPDLAPLSSDRAISWRPYDLFHDPEPVVVGEGSRVEVNIEASCFVLRESSWVEIDVEASCFGLREGSWVEIDVEARSFVNTRQNGRPEPTRGRGH
jgi:hypothetical protein